jgi:hypothetical protein
MAPRLTIKKAKGQNLGETALLVGLVSIIGVGSLVALSQNVNSLFNNTIVSKGQPSNALTSQTGIPSSANGAGNPTGGASSALPPPAPNQTQFCNEAGFCLNLYDVKPGQTINEVAGGNGGEDLILGYSDNLLRIRDYLATQGASNDIVNLLTQMANKGHTLGSTYQDLKSQCISNTRGECYAQVELTPAEYTALKNNTVDGASELLNRYNIAAPNKIAFSEFETIYLEEIKPLLLSKSSENSAINSMMGLVDYHFQQISTIHTDIMIGAGTSLNQETQTLQLKMNLENNARLETVQESNAICQTGGDMQQCFKPVTPETN